MLLMTGLGKLGRSEENLANDGNGPEAPHCYAWVVPQAAAAPHDRMEPRVDIAMILTSISDTLPELFESRKVWTDEACPVLV